MLRRWRAWRLRVAREDLEDIEWEVPMSWEAGLSPRERRYYDRRIAKLRARVDRLTEREDPPPMVWSATGKGRDAAKRYGRTPASSTPTQGAPDA